MSKPRPPEPADDSHWGSSLPRAPAEPDRVTVNFKTTDKWGDTFVSLDVGYSSSARAGTEGPLALYRRVAATVNQMYNERKAEVQKALGRKPR